MTNRNGIQTNRKKAEDAAKAAMASIQNKIVLPGENIWDLACESSGVICDANVPITSFRHLIASWAGVRSGVCYGDKILRNHIKSLEDKITALADALTLVLEEKNDKQEEFHELDKSDMAHRTGRVLVNAKAPETLIAQVAEEMGS